MTSSSASGTGREGGMGGGGADERSSAEMDASTRAWTAAAEHACGVSMSVEAPLHEDWPLLAHSSMLGHGGWAGQEFDEDYECGATLLLLNK